MARKLIGIIVSDKMDKTVVVAVQRLKTHPIYKKQYKQTKNIKAHDADNVYKIGDTVEIAETNPISKDKKFVVTQKVERKGKSK
jgi:small subunit ribosomal protein S17